MPNVKLKGLGVALATPFHADYSVDYNALHKLLDYLLDGGVDYLVALGTTAETPTLSEREQSDIIRFVTDTVRGKVPVIMGVGGNNTVALAEKLRSIDMTGISAVLSVTPYYNKPSQEGLYRHYCTLSEASPLPLILYNVPGRTGVNMTAETTLRIARSCGNIIAIKEASSNLAEAKEIIAGAPEGFSVISGDDAMTLPIIRAGGAGVISVLGNAFPHAFGKMVHHALDNQWTKAEEIEQSFTELIRLLFCDGNPSGVKAMLHLKGLTENVLRLPLVAVSDETREMIKHQLSLVEK